MPPQSIHPVPPGGSSFTLKPIAETHLEAALRLSRQTGWPHRLEDWAMALSLSQGVIAVDSHGEAVGTVLLTPFGPDAATINMVIVDRDRRGQGLGRRLMAAALEIGGARRLRLVATPDGMPLYRQLGFVEAGIVAQHQGQVLPVPAPAGVTLADSHDLDAIITLDRAATGADRAGLIAAIAATGRFAVLRQDRTPIGFAALRPFGRGEVIGPVAAATAPEAKALIAFFLARRPGAFLRVDSHVAQGLGAWLAARGLPQVDTGTDMHRPAPAPRLSPPVSIFALASQAVG